MHMYKTEKRTIIFLCVVDIKTGWEETKHWPNVESTDETDQLGRTNIIPWSRLFGLHSTGVRNEQRYCRKLQKDVRIHDLRRSKRKNYPVQEDVMQRFLHDLLLWMIMQRNVVSDIASWLTKQLSSCTKCALKLFWHVCMWHALRDQTSYGL